MNAETASICPQATPRADAPRKRRRPWRAVLLFFLVSISALVGFFYYRSWQLERDLQALYDELDRTDPGWRWHDIVRNYKKLPDEQNPGVFAMRAHAKLGKPAFNLGGKDYLFDVLENHRNARLTAAQVAVLRATLEKVPADGLADVRKLKDMPGGQIETEFKDDPWAILLPQVQDLRELMNLLSHDAIMRAQDGDVDGALDNARAIVHGAQAIGAHPFAIACLVRNAGRAIASGSIERTLAQGEASPDALLALQEALQREVEENGLEPCIRGERAACQQVHDQIRSGKLKISRLMGRVGGGAKPSAEETVVDLFPHFFLRHYPDVLRKMNALHDASKLPEHQRLPRFREIDADIKKSGNLLIRLLMPALHKVCEADTRVQAQLRCALAGVALERYRQAHGVWPATPKSLEGEFLKAWPMDPFDGKPLRIKATPTGVLIYSVGVDGVDDGGNVNRSAPVSPGVDLGFELWSPRFRRVQPPPAWEDKTP